MNLPDNTTVTRWASVGFNSHQNFTYPSEEQVEELVAFFKPELAEFDEELFKTLHRKLLRYVDAKRDGFIETYEDAADLKEQILAKPEGEKAEVLIKTLAYGKSG